MANRFSSQDQGSQRRLTTVNPNSQTVFVQNLDSSTLDPDDIDNDRPVIHNVLLSDSRRYFPADISNSQPVAAAYYTSQIKRKRIEQGTNNLPNDLVTTQLDSIQKLMAEINRRMDTMSKRENEVEKRLDNFDKRIVGLVRRVNKNPAPSEMPAELPVVEYEGTNLLASPVALSPACLMKRLINQLFTKEDIINGEHEKNNLKIEKIKEAIKICFYRDDADKLEGFWSFEGKIIQGNQRRGLAHRKKQKSAFVQSPQPAHNNLISATKDGEILQENLDNDL